MSYTVQHTCCSHTDSNRWGYTCVQTQQQHLWLRGVSKPTQCWSQWLHHKRIAHHILSSHSGGGSEHSLNLGFVILSTKGPGRQPKSPFCQRDFCFELRKNNTKIPVQTHVDNPVHNWLCITSEQHVDNFRLILPEKLSTGYPQCQLAPTNSDPSAQPCRPSRAIVLRTYALIIAKNHHFVKRVFAVCCEKATSECGQKPWWHQGYWQHGQNTL